MFKLDLGSLRDNIVHKGGGGNASWETSMGQGVSNKITQPGAQEIYDAIKLNGIAIDFENPKLELSNRPTKDNFKIIVAGVFDKVFVNEKLVEAPFILVVKERTNHSIKERIGNKSLRFSKFHSWGKYDNALFFEKISDVLAGEKPAWFATYIQILNTNELHFTIVKVSDTPKIYANNKLLKAALENASDDVSETVEDIIIAEFKDYLLNVHKIKNVKTANEYVRALPVVKEWFIKNKLCDDDFQIWNPENDIKHIQDVLSGKLKVAWQKAAKKDRSGDYGFMMASWNSWVKFIEWRRNGSEPGKVITNFNVALFQTAVVNSGLLFSDKLIIRFIASLCTKPFLICSGLSGSGKTKLAQAFVQWICESDKQYKIIPVGADWTNREPLLGYPNGLEPKSYATPDSGALQLILEAIKGGNQSKPYFMILDEMNLSHVERYFADFLSTMESGEKLKLYSGEKRYSKTEDGKDPDESYFIPTEIEWPKNLFIIGTVNIDETTYMFSPKVLDRANVIEFRISDTDLAKYLESPKNIDMDWLLENPTLHIGYGAKVAKDFLRLSEKLELKNNIDTKDTLVNFFVELQKAGAEFGYRSAFEINNLIALLDILTGNINEWDGKVIKRKNDFVDIAIMQKLLPKLHGSRNKLIPILTTLAKFCVYNAKETFKEKDKEFRSEYFEKENKLGVIYSLSFEKIKRMYHNAITNGFTSYAEA